MQVMKTHYRTLKLKDIKLPPRTQMRTGESLTTIERYAENYRSGKKMPAPVVFHRFGGPYYLADGRHRLKGAAKAGLTELEVEVHDGTLNDAILYAAGANDEHGLPRSREDVQKAIVTLLLDRHWRKWANTEIARVVKAPVAEVAKIRDLLGMDDDGKRTFTDRNGKVRTQDVRGIIKGQKKRAEENRAKRERCPMCGRPL